MKQLRESILDKDFIDENDLLITSKKYPWLDWPVMQRYTFIDDLKLINGNLVKDVITKAIKDATEKVVSCMNVAGISDANDHLIGSYRNAIGLLNQAYDCANSFGKTNLRQNQIMSNQAGYAKMCKLLDKFFTQPKIANILSKQRDRGDISLFMKGSNIDEKQLMIIIDEKLTRERDILFEACKEVSERNNIPIELYTDTDKSYVIVIKLNEAL